MENEVKALDNCWHTYLVEHKDEFLVGARVQHGLFHLHTSTAQGISSIQHLQYNIRGLNYFFELPVVGPQALVHPNTILSRGNVCRLGLLLQRNKNHIHTRGTYIDTMV